MTMAARADFSVAVVGGGPAGATASRLLAERGARVTLFEALPRAEKPCGGGVPSTALDAFPGLMRSSLPRRVVREVLVISPSNLEARIPLQDGIHVFSRRDLDGFLRDRAQAAGAALACARVRGVGRVGAAWEVRTDDGVSGPFDFLVGADGVRSVVRRSLGHAWPDSELTLALYAYVPGVSRSEMVLKFLPDIDGYIWAFPRADHVSVGICARHRSVAHTRLRDELLRFVEGHYPEGRFPERDLRGYFIPAAPHPPGPRGIVARRWALIGDAAGFVDPLTREGIAHAVRSAAAMAGALAARGRIATPALPANLAWAHRHGTGFYRKAFLDAMTHLAARSISIRGVLGDLLEGRQGYRGLKTRLLMRAVSCGREAGLGELFAAARGALRP